MREEIVLAHRTDPDFGELTFVETRTAAAVDGGPMKPLVFRDWHGTAPGLGAKINISSEINPPQVDDAVRQAYRKIIADIDGLKKTVASQELDTAREWAAAGGIELALDEAGLAALLRVDGFSVDPGRLTIWLVEDKDIFAGHALEVRIENGKIIEICLSG